VYRVKDLIIDGLSMAAKGAPVPSGVWLELKVA
jgi:hypothetical protein